MLTDAQEQFIQHEVKLRVLQEIGDQRYQDSNKLFEKVINRLDRMDKTLTSLSVQFKIITGVIGLIAIPVLLHYFKVT